MLCLINQSMYFYLLVSPLVYLCKYVMCTQLNPWAEGTTRSKSKKYSHRDMIKVSYFKQRMFSVHTTIIINASYIKIYYACIVLQTNHGYLKIYFILNVL